MWASVRLTQVNSDLHVEGYGPLEGPERALV